MSNSRPQLFGLLAGLFLAAGLVLSTMVATAAWLKVRNSQFITVKGSARKNVESDLVVWRGNFTVQAPTLLEAQRMVQTNRLLVINFLKNAGVTNWVFASVGIDEIRATHKTQDNWSEQKTTGFRLSQSVRVEFSNVDTVDRLDTTPLVEQGVMFTTEPPQFIYTSVGEAKIEMLAEATKDARARAEQIGSQGGRSIQQLHSADMGIFQITPRYESKTSWQGENDTTTRQKTVTAVVTATFLLK
jgi:hypothetical protein